jgi:hypothetical protein
VTLTIAVANKLDLALYFTASDEASRSPLGHLLDASTHQLVTSNSDLNQRLTPVTFNLALTTACLVITGNALSKHKIDGILELSHVHSDWKKF